MKRIVFVMSDTGNGHRTAAQAISTALDMKYGDQVQCEIVDIFKQYTPFPFKNFPEFYPRMVQHSSYLYSAAFKLSNTPKRARLLASALYAMSYAQLRQLASDYEADAIVSTHSIITSPSFSAMSKLEKRPLFFTVVVDLISTHMFWYDKRSDIFLLPTQSAHNNGLSAGINTDKMVVTGIPVHPKFSDVSKDKKAVRQQLGWNLDLPTVLLTGGGDGISRLYDIATGINESRLPVQIAVITGRNHALKQALDNIDWHYPAHIYSFVNNMHELMSASDLLLTKAGSLTISEACVVGLPMLLYEALPGQEEGNLSYVVDNQAGWYTPSTRTILRKLKQLIQDDTDDLTAYKANARRLSQPDAASNIAEIIWQNLH